MCGICGIFDRRGKPIEAATLLRMTGTLLHRGPDEGGYYINSPACTNGASPAQAPAGLDPTQPVRRVFAGSILPGGRVGGGHGDAGRGYASHGGAGNGSAGRGDAGLGHRRLSILDLAGGQQPLSNEDGTLWISFNGEIYNFLELKETLEARGHRFRTHSDTEAIVHAYEEWGAECPVRLRGMFAFAIWDEKKRCLFLARDRVGKKPLYYLDEPSRFAFASEIKALLELEDVDRSLDFSALSDYLSLLYIPAPRTIFSKIRKLPAGHSAVADAGGITVRKYWDLAFYPGTTESEGGIEERILSILTDATRLRLISEVPLGAFLSGGVDSSAVVALMADASSEPVITNAISFSVAKYNEADHARRVSELFSTRHHEFSVTPEAIPVIEKLAWHYDEPFADSSAVPSYYVSKMARQSVTVALSGDGGDENFAGYRRYYFDQREHFVRSLFPTSLRRGVFGFLGSLYPKADYLPRVFRGKAFISNVAREPSDAYFHSVSAFKEDEKRLLLNRDALRQLSEYRTSDLFADIYRSAPAIDPLSRIQYLDVKTYLCDDILTKVDRASMAVSLEVRCPLLDHVFMEYAATIPASHKLRGKEGKYIFKKALRKKLPPDILDRKKMGFGVPILEWLRGDLKDYSRERILKGEATRKYLNEKHVEKLLREHEIGIRNWSTHLWVLLMLNLWHERFA